MKLKNNVLAIILSFIGLANSGSVLAAPQPPQLIGPVGMNQDSEVLFAWFEVSNATWYRISAWNDSGVVFRQWLKDADTCGIQEGGVCVYDSTIPTQGLGVTRWQMKAYDGSQQSGWSAVEKFWDGLSAPVPPLLLAPVGFASIFSIGDFSWSSITDATWYRLEVVDDNSANLFASWLKVGRDVDCVGSDCSFTADTFPPFLGEQFSWRVRTYNGAMVGSWSNWEVVQTSIGD